MGIRKLLNKLESSDKVSSTLLSSIRDSLSQPMLVEPSMIDGYVRTALLGKSAIHTHATLEGSNKAVHSYIMRDIKAGVLEISGALTARDEHRECEATPASYAAIKQNMELMLAEDVDFIIARIDSGGGQASQMFDLSRWIKSLRTEVRLLAVIDDNAYSAAYGIASAFDSIYVSDTSGALSIGVVMRHVHKADPDAEITYIYAGERKIDMSPDLPLSEDAQLLALKEVQRLYGLFTELVAVNLDISTDAVESTKAGTLHGSEIVSAGYATEVLTFDGVIQKIYNGEIMTLDEIKEAKGRITSQEANIVKAKRNVEEAEAKLSDADKAKLSAETQPKTEMSVAELKADQLAKVKTQQDAKVEAQKKAESERLEMIAHICNAGNVSNELQSTLLASGVSVKEASTNVADFTKNEHNINSSQHLETNNLSETEAEKHKRLVKSWEKAFS